MKLARLALALTLALGFTAVAQAQTTMRISISIAKDSHQGVGIDTFASEVEKRTGGRYKVQTFCSGSLGGERESIEAVQLGTQELTLTSTGPIPNFALPRGVHGPAAGHSGRAGKPAVGDHGRQV